MKSPSFLKWMWQHWVWDNQFSVSCYFFHCYYMIYIYTSINIIKQSSNHFFTNCTFIHIHRWWHGQGISSKQPSLIREVTQGTTQWNCLAIMNLPDECERGREISSTHISPASSRDALWASCSHMSLGLKANACTLAGQGVKLGAYICTLKIYFFVKSQYS